MDLKQFDFNKLDQKQKMMIPVAAVLVIFVLWQVFALFGGDDDFADTAPTQTATLAPGASGVGVPGALVDPFALPDPNVTTVTATNIREIAAQPPTQQELADLENAKQMRRIYLNLLQQYQIATVQKMLVETRAAIATSDANLAKQKLEKVRADNQTAALEGGNANFGTGTGAGAGATGAGTEAGMSGAGAEQGMDDTGPSDKFTVAYIGKRQGQWSAIIMLESKPIDARVGTRLPDDSKVMSINRDNVLIAKNMKRRLLTLPASSKALFAKPKTAEGSSEQTAASVASEFTE